MFLCELFLNFLLLSSWERGTIDSIIFSYDRTRNSLRLCVWDFLAAFCSAHGAFRDIARDLLILIFVLLLSTGNIFSIIEFTFFGVVESFPPSWGKVHLDGVVGIVPLISRLFAIS